MSNEDLSPGANGPQSLLNDKAPADGPEHQQPVDTDEDLEPCEWRRISKLRRSLQLPSTSSSSSSIRSKFGSRPLDLPENLVSVSKIREELENGSRLDRAMRNNHVDLLALNNILKGVPESGACKMCKCELILYFANKIAAKNGYRSGVCLIITTTFFIRHMPMIVSWLY